jgi:hypothetical protein
VDARGHAQPADTGASGLADVWCSPAGGCTAVGSFQFQTVLVDVTDTLAVAEQP